MAAGLIVGFPVDLRYGWNVNDPVHISMLRRAQQEFRPGVLHMAPDCGPWSVSGNLRPPELKAEDRRRDRNALMTVQEAAEEQSRGGRGYNVEHPYGSAMWKEDDQCPLRLSSIPDHRGRQRCDQCMMGAKDEGGIPIQKATGFGSNLRWRRTSIRCSGHKGQPHSHLQGTAPDGLARTAKAAVYPREMCQRMKQDVVKFLHQRGLLKTALEVTTSSSTFTSVHVVSLVDPALLMSSTLSFLDNAGMDVGHQVQVLELKLQMPLLILSSSGRSVPTRRT